MNREILAMTIVALVLVIAVIAVIAVWRDNLPYSHPVRKFSKTKWNTNFVNTLMGKK